MITTEPLGPGTLAVLVAGEVTFSNVSGSLFSCGSALGPLYSHAAT